MWPQRYVEMKEPYYTMGAVGLIRGKIKNLGPAIVKAATQADSALKEVDTSHFGECINVNHVIRYGEERREEIEIRKNRRNREFEVATQISLAEGRKIEDEPESLTELCLEEIQRALAELSRKHEFPKLNIT